MAQKSTQLVHLERKINNPAHGAVHHSTNNSVLFDYADVADLEAVFQGKKAGHVYARSSSDSVMALQNMLCELEGGSEACVFSTGMAAINALTFSLLKAGDHIIVSQYLFGNTRSYFERLLGFGVDISFVDVTDADRVIEKVKENTRMVFCETIANPGTQVADLVNIGTFCKAKNIIFAIDNTVTPNVMFNANLVHATFIVCSLTKYVAGHGNVLGGVLVDMGNFDWQRYDNIDAVYRGYEPAKWGITQIKKKGLRDMGATLACASAHQIAVGLETLELRLQRMSENAHQLALFCKRHNAFNKVNYPGLVLHPQHERAGELFSLHNDKPCYGAILSVELAPNKNMRKFLNALKVVLRATHLGDTRTLALPVASTIFYELGAEKRAQMGIADGLIRLSVGIENTADLLADFIQALELS